MGTTLPAPAEFACKARAEAKLTWIMLSRRRKYVIACKARAEAKFTWIMLSRRRKYVNCVQGE